MLGTVRYKDVRNATGAVFTASNFPYTTDGDDKQQKTVKRILAAIDVGTDAGKTRHASGVIIDVIGSTYNVLWVEVSVSRALTNIGTKTPYSNILGEVAPLPTPTTQYDFSWFVDADNCLRLVDAGAAAATRLVAGDTICAIITLGQPESALDVLDI